MAAGLLGCERGPAPAVQPALIDEPVIRVRIGRDVESVRLADPASIEVRAEGAAPRTLNTPVEFALGPDGWRIDGEDDADLGEHALLIAPVDLAVTRVDDRWYPGALRLVPRIDDGGAAARFDVVNHVPLEAYVPGVLARELYDDWRLAAYHAQAVAARSYAIAEMLDASVGLWYDVEDTTASQAYLGYTDHPTARQATLDTTGLVLTWRGEVVKAYYASTCGGAGLSPQDAWGQAAPAPLTPRPHDPWCARSPHFQRDSITRDRRTLSRRMAAWGKHHYRPIGQLGQITTLSIAERNPVGRPSRFAITDDRGRRFVLEADTFRTACNYGNSSRGLRPPLRRDRLRTNFVNPIVKADRVIFEDVRGLGHGVGLCQFGAQAMAEAGHDGVEILQTYYPGAEIERVY